MPTSRVSLAVKAAGTVRLTAGESPPVEPRSSHQAVIHADTSFLVDLLRDTARGTRGPATALLEEIAREEIRVGVHVVCSRQSTPGFWSRCAAAVGR